MVRQRRAPGPPYDGPNGPWNYFKHDASRWIDQNRPLWNNNQKSHTMSTMWAADDIAVGNPLHVHYAQAVANRVNTGPGLPLTTVFPHDPYTERHLREAKNGLPPPLPFPPIPPPPGNPPPPNTRPLPPPPPSNGLPTVATATVPPIMPPPAPPLRAAPFGHWPQVSWTFADDPVNTVPCTKPGGDLWRTQVADWLDIHHGKTKGGHEDITDKYYDWKGARVLGRGASGVAGLWVKLDDDNNIEDTVVIKDMQDLPQWRWRDPLEWIDQVPREVRIHQFVEECRMSDSDACRHIIEYKGHRIVWTQNRFRLYLEYCNGGDLFHADDPLFRVETAISDYFLPEPFLWYIIKSLSSACLLLENGVPNIRNWKSIRHLDITNTANILLKYEPFEDTEGKRKRKGDEANIPDNQSGSNKLKKPKHRVIPKITDFGLSHRIEPEDLSDPNRYPHNPLDLLMYETDGRYAPEQQNMDDNRRQRSIDQYRKIDEKTDSWHIGSAAWQTMICESASGAPKYDFTPEYLGHDEVSLHGFINAAVLTDADNFLTGEKHHGANFYTKTLRNLVTSCCRWQQNERPTLSKIHEIATRELDLFLEEQYVDPEAALLKGPEDLDTFDIGAFLDRGELPFLPTPVLLPQAAHFGQEVS